MIWSLVKSVGGPVILDFGKDDLVAYPAAGKLYHVHPLRAAKPLAGAGRWPKPAVGALGCVWAMETPPALQKSHPMARIRQVQPGKPFVGF